MEINKIYNNNCLEFLPTVEDKSINSCITSPPYYKQKNYKSINQLGQEKSIDEYLNNLLLTFTEISRVLKDNGTCFINLGDVYINKCLQRLPFKLADLLCDNLGWTLRNIIIWHKPRCIPNSTKDSFTVDYEPVLFFSKRKNYYFEQQFDPHTNAYTIDCIKKATLLPSDHQSSSYDIFNKEKRHENKSNNKLSRGDLGKRMNPLGRNKRSVWKINPANSSLKHIAMFPEELIIPFVKGGCPPNGTIIDPFMGSGTVGVVCKKLNRNYIGVEINPEYCQIAENRIQEILI